MDAGHAHVDLDRGITDLFLEHTLGQSYQSLGASARNEHARINQVLATKERLLAQHVGRGLAGNQASGGMRPKIGHRLRQGTIRTTEKPGAILV